MYALVDGNNFYVSCERVFRHSLQGRPVVVLFDGHVLEQDRHRAFAFRRNKRLRPGGGRTYHQNQGNGQSRDRGTESKDGHHRGSLPFLLVRPGFHRAVDGHGVATDDLIP